MELGRDPIAAERIARATIEESTGRLLDGVGVDVTVQTEGERSVVVVSVSGQLAYPGPLPFSPAITARASAARELPVR